MTIVGSMIMDDGSYHAYCWTQASGAKDLGTMDGKFTYTSYISADGSVIGGSTQTADGNTHPYIARIDKQCRLVLKGALP